MNEDRHIESLERLNEMAQLSSAVGHHVINAFCAIVSAAEIMKPGTSMPPGMDTGKAITTIIDVAIAASNVARQLIGFSHSFTAPGEGPLALDRLVARFCAAEARAHPGIQWLLDLAPVPPIKGSEPQLLALLGHLVTNAREALPPGGGSITLSTARDERGWVALEVRDNGRGMCASEHAHAVEPFFTTKPGHVGVGLSIANGIWRRHRGTLAIQSRPGEGTRVRLFIEPDRDRRAPCTADVQREAAPAGS